MEHRMIALKILGFAAVTLVVMAGWAVIGAIITGTYNALVNGTSWGKIDDDEGRVMCMIGWPIWLVGLAVVWPCWAFGQLGPVYFMEKLTDAVEAGLSNLGGKIKRWWCGACNHAQG